jgi:CheY-like chemotaxis protein
MMALIRPLIADRGRAMGAFNRHFAPTANSAIGSRAAHHESIAPGKALPNSCAVDSAPVPGPASSSRPVTVLVIDDDPGVTETFARTLTLEQYAVRTALTAEAGLHEAAASRPDAILLDLRMPIVDGLAFLRRLRAHEPLQHIPVAIVTGAYFLEDDVTRELAELGAEMYFKPLWIEDLISIVNALVKPLH